ncbi:MAG: patatin family protein [Defluviitaleaceae bacterium]|nr:patatin family protein [Defluviitaleaceae bacterium]
MNFTHEIIKGTPHKKMLRKGTGLVLEGGGMRGFFSAGVFEAFMDEGIMFPYIAGVSAGAANAYTYIAGQRLRNRQIVEFYAHDKNYISYRNLLRKGSLFGYDFIFRGIPARHIFFDRENFDNTDIRFLTGAMDCATGETVWFEKHDISDDYMEIVASCSVPLAAGMIKHRGMELLDGGVSSPIPIEKSIADGNDFHVIVLTRNHDYVAAAAKHTALIKFFYRKYPKLVEAMLTRHERYNQQILLCKKLVAEQKAIIIRPQLPIAVGRTTTDTAKLLALYDEGHDEGKKVVQNHFVTRNTT